MPSNRARFITACQQLLALGVVLAVLTPAASVVSLDVVAQSPATASDASRAVLSSSEVAAEPVEPEVTEYALEPTAGGAGETGEPSAAAGEPGSGQAQGDAPADEQVEPPVDEQAPAPDQAVVSAPVEGYGAVGVTWSAEAEVAEDGLALQVRTREGDAWSGWTELEYHDDHAPDPGSPDALSARPGTEPLIVGDVDEVQVRADGEATLPADLSLAVVDPGEVDTRQEAPELAIDAGEGSPAGTTDADGEEALVLQAARRGKAVQPTIYSRAQWGADERIRDKGSLRYGTISAGFVHHTVNANDYTADQVPGILRSIYAYHVKSRGWSDIGYNFLVDRFGRIWEGRHGGIDKAVVGAHTLGYNDYAFAMSAIGNFDVVRPSAEMLNAYGQLFAWKLGLHGVNPTSTSQKVGRSVFPAINGHRDAGSTACPGQYLYAQLPAIRKAAAAATTAPAPAPAPAPPTTPAPPAEPQWKPALLNSNLVGTPHPDLVVRRAADGRGFVIPTGGLTAFTRTTTLQGSGWKSQPDALVSPDLTGDGVPDLVFTSRQGVGRIRPGNGAGGFGKVVRTVRAMRDHRMITAVGDINGDGRNDLVALTKRSREAVAFLGAPRYGLKKVSLGRSWGRYVSLVGVGDVNTDGHADLMGRDSAGVLWTRLGTGSAGFRQARKTPGDWSAYDQLVGGQDFNGDGRPDLVARQRSGKVYVLPGNGDRTFGHPIGPTANLPRLTGLSAAQVTGSPAPDLLARKGGALVVVPNRGTFELGAPVDTGADLSASDLLINVGDWDKDGFGDVVTRQTNGDMVLRRGNGQGQLAAPKRIGTGWGPLVSIAAVGDVTGDGFPDLVGQLPGGVMHLYRGQGAAGMLAGVPAAGIRAPAARLAAQKPFDLSPFDWKVGISDAQLGQATDLLVREAATGRLFLVNGTPNGLKGRRYLGDGLGAYDLAG